MCKRDTSKTRSFRRVALADIFCQEAARVEGETAAGREEDGPIVELPCELKTQPVLVEADQPTHILNAQGDNTDTILKHDSPI